MNAIITGAGRPAGIGAHIAYALAEMKINVMLTSSRNYDLHNRIIESDNGGEKLSAYSSIAKKCQSFGVKAFFKEYDLSSQRSVISLFDDANKVLGDIDVLVTCHCCHAFDSFGSIKEEDFDCNLSVNTKATFMLCQEFYNRFNNQSGRIVNISSTQALEPLTSEVSYAITKSTIPVIVSTLAPIMAKKNITINAVNPGPTDVGDNNYDEFNDINIYKEKNLFGRVSKPEDAANIVSFLISDKGKWITGQTINSEGGLFRKSSYF